MKSKHSLFQSFRFAFKGFAAAFKERNFIIHLSATFLVIVFGCIFSISIPEWISISICVALVLSLELMNSSIERIIDLLHPQQDPKAGEIKDIAAASVLISVIISVIIGLIIFLPKIYRIFFSA